MNSRIKKVVLFLAGSLLFLWGPAEKNPALWAKESTLSSKARLIRIEEKTSPDRLRILITTSQRVIPRAFILSGPPSCLAVDLTPCLMGDPSSYPLKDPYVERLRIAQFDPKTVRVVFYLPMPIKYKITTERGKPFRIVVDLIKGRGAPSVFRPAKKEVALLTATTIEQFKEETSLREKRLKEAEAHSQKKRVNFDFYMTNLHNVLRLIGEIGGVNIVVGDDVKEKKITLSLKEIPWDDALNSILESNNLRKLERGEKTFLITTSETYKKIRDEELKSKNEELKNEFENLKNDELRQKLGKVPWITRQFQIKNIDVKFIEDKIKEVEEKEALQAGKTTAGAALGTPGMVSLERTVRWTGVTLISVPHTNTLIVKGTERDVEYIGELIKAIDQPIPQVMIEARIVEADTNFTRDLGIRWGGAYALANTNAPFAGTIRGGEAGLPGSNYAVNLPLASTSTAFGGLGIAFAGTNFNLDARLQAMEKEGRGRTISSPKILTKPDNEATIKQGQSIPVTTRDQNNAFTTTYRDAALILSVKPQIASSKKIRIKVKISKNEPDFTKVDSLGNPTINMKEAETEMIVNDGDTVVIGGIIFKTESYQTNKVPGLGDIPFLGWLFKTKYKSTDDSELLIFLTPKIERASTPETATLEH